MMSRGKKKALGRGLDALLGDGVPSLLEMNLDQLAAEAPKAELFEVAVGALTPNPHQPRRHFDEQALEELAESIREHGVLQPVLATRREEKGAEGYYLLAGERRWRAAQRAGLATVPCRVIAATKEQVLELALIENVQREDLNAVEEARGYAALTEHFKYTQEQVAKRVGKSRVAVANAVRLLKLPTPVLEDLEEGRLTAGHARAILSLHHPGQQEILRQEILAQDLTVRGAETRAKEIGEGRAEKPQKSVKGRKSLSETSLDVVQLQEKLLLRLGCPVRLKPRSQKSGTLTIQYQSLDDLDRVLGLLQVSPDED